MGVRASVSPVGSPNPIPSYFDNIMGTTGQSGNHTFTFFFFFGNLGHIDHF